MFDIGFWEICLIAVVALLVFGPEKLPEAARTAGLWVGRARRFISTIKQDIDKELHLQEVQDAIKKRESNSLHQFIDETKNELEEFRKPLFPTENTASSKTSTTNHSPGSN